MQAMVRGVLLVVFATCATLVSAGLVPRDHSLTLFNASANDSRYSTDVFEDAKLSVPELVKKYRYPVEVHNVTTSDGYILEMHRIPHGRDQNNVPDAKKPVVFLMHGLLCSSAIWVLAGPGSGLAYILAEAGYDVWMGNARGNFYSRKHTSLNPDALLNTAFWQFSWDEMGNIDLPTMIDFALNKSSKDKLHYIGHSQGSTAFFVMTSLLPAYNDKITSMHALAPVAYMANNRNLLLNVISPFANNIETVGSLLGIGEFLPNSVIFTWAGQAICRDEVITQPICGSILFLIGGWNEAQLNTTILPTIFGHTPAGSSVRQLVHYAQGISGKQFRRYDHGSRRANRRAYGSSSPPAYNLGKVTTPVFLHFSDNDPLAHVNDVDRLFRELGRPIGKFRVPLASFTHLDFMWGIDAKELVYDRVINLIGAMETNTLNDISTY
ncbi:lipase 3-like [Anticarsia gemmatalis]|uniref:lipase 3-like n=1 Tax=Anticarsia gemmatalis TaxID=129554 RepID=UPI003F76FD61